jgi:hypothetical protein
LIIEYNFYFKIEYKYFYKRKLFFIPSLFQNQHDIFPADITLRTKPVIMERSPRTAPKLRKGWLGPCGDRYLKLNRRERVDDYNFLL